VKFLNLKDGVKALNLDTRNFTEKHFNETAQGFKDGLN